MSGGRACVAQAGDCAGMRCPPAAAVPTVRPMARLLQLLALGFVLAGASYGLLSASTGWSYSYGSSASAVTGVLLIALGAVVVLVAAVTLGVRLHLDAT